MLTIILTLLVVQSVLTAVHLGAANEDAEYFQKAIFKTLKAKNGQFRSDVIIHSYWSPYKDLIYELPKGRVMERFCFKSNIGETSYFSKENYGYFAKQNLYVNGKELYTIFPIKKKCLSQKLDKSKVPHLIR